MAERISIKLSNANDWIVDEIERLRIEQNRTKNNFIETVLLDYIERENARKLAKKQMS